MSNNSRWPEAWDRLVDRVNQDPNIEAFEKIDSFNGSRGAISSLKNLKTEEKFTCFTSYDSLHADRMVFIYGKRRRMEQFNDVDELIEKFNQSYDGPKADSENEMGIVESKRLIKLKTLIEGYAWERKPGKPLPTLSEVQAEHERKTKLKEPRWWDSDGDGKPYELGDDVNEASKFYRGSRYNDEPFDFKDDKPSRPKMQTPKEWDDLMDLVNNDPRFETYTGEDGYQIKDTKGGHSNLTWQLTPGRYSWKGIGRSEAGHPRQFNDVAELIKNFYEVTGLSNPNNSDVNLGENMRRFGTKNI